MFAAYGSRTHSIVEVQVPQSNHPENPSTSEFGAMKMHVLSWSEVSETTIINCFRKAIFKEGMSNEDDDPFFALESSIDQLRQRDENLVPNDFIYEETLSVRHVTIILQLLEG